METKLFSEENAKELCKWKYDGQYAVYNFPKWADVYKQNWAIANDKKRKNEFLSVYEEEEFIGFIRFVNNDGYYIVGLGLKPSYCGKGYGAKLMKMIKDEAIKKKIKRLVLEVRSFNQRAIKCYEKSGFTIFKEVNKDTLIGNSDFYQMQILF